MNNTKLTQALIQEINGFIHSRKSLQLATLTIEGEPYASYAPFSIGDGALYVLISDLAVHAINLKNNPAASVLILEDEASADELFARLRVNFSVRAELIEVADGRRAGIINGMVQRLGERVRDLSELTDFRLFKLVPVSGRYVKGFGRAYAITGEVL